MKIGWPIWKPRRSLMADCVRMYWRLGYTEYKNFSNEYFYMFNPQTHHMVRLYYSGGIREGKQ